MKWTWMTPEGTSYKQNHWKAIYLVEKQHVDSASGWEENGKTNLLVQQHTTEIMVVSRWRHISSGLESSHFPPHTSYMVLPSKPSHRPDCCWRDLEGAGRTHRRVSQAGASHPLLPGTQCSVSGSCPQGTSQESTRKTQFLVDVTYQELGLSVWGTDCRKSSSLD